jgi:prepilin-type N-terminal cleavage/methylation domain-containing protein
MKTSVHQRAFTLIELLVVIAIIGLLAAVTVPAIGNMKRSDALTAATRQLLDDVGRARQLAISRHTTVYMIFVPANFHTAPAFNALDTVEKPKAERLLDKQYIGYTFVTLRSVGDQPGQGVPDYIGPWRTLPENTFIATNKFFYDTNRFDEILDPPGATAPDRRYRAYGFSRTDIVPFPSEVTRSASGRYVAVPYLAFNYLGQLISGVAGQDEYLPIARGIVAQPRDPKTRTAKPGVAILSENPPNNSSNSFNLIRIDRLTGRARHVKQEISGT